MALLQEWRDIAYSQETDRKQLQKFWSEYFLTEKGIYEQLLENPEEAVTGTVKELAEKYNIPVLTMTGFLDGINDSLKKPNPIEEMTEDTVVSLDFDNELLYKNMVDAKADWLYELPQWNDIFTEEKRKELYKEQKKSGTVVKPHKIGRNDPCPCGSGKKYKDNETQIRSGLYHCTWRTCQWHKAYISPSGTSQKGFVVSGRKSGYEGCAFRRTGQRRADQ